MYHIVTQGTKYSMRREEKVQEAKEKKKDIRFVACHIKTLGKIDLCRVPTARHLAKTQFAVCFLVALGKNLIYHVLNFCREFLWPALDIYWVCRVPVMLLTVKSQAHSKLKVSHSEYYQRFPSATNVHISSSVKSPTAPQLLDSGLMSRSNTISVLSVMSKLEYIYILYSLTSYKRGTLKLIVQYIYLHYYLLHAN